MALFKDMLKSDETLFKNDIALDYSFMPKLIPYRAREQKQIAACIKPLFDSRNGRNLIITGTPGIGKTVACKHVLKELEDETDDIIPLYVNCWQHNTSFKIITEICHSLGYKFTQNKKTEELFDTAKNIINKKSVVLVFDEIDKVEDFDFLYSLLEEVYRRAIILITNKKEGISVIDSRIKSRLMPETIEFLPYSLEETKGIMEQRKTYAFVEGVWEKDAFESVVRKTFEFKDIRAGLYLMKEAAITAEDESSRKVSLRHVENAIGKLSDFCIKDTNELEDDTKEILGLVKQHSGKKIGELFAIYQEKNKGANYKTFQRRIKKLADNSFVTVDKVTGGSEGTTTIVNYEKTTKLDEF